MFNYNVDHFLLTASPSRNSSPPPWNAHLVVPAINGSWPSRWERSSWDVICWSHLDPIPHPKGTKHGGSTRFNHEKVLVVIKQHEKWRFDMAWSSWTWMQLGYIALYMLFTSLYIYDFIKTMEYLWINGHKWAQWGTDRTVDLVHSTRFSRPQPYHTVVSFHSETFGETAKSSQICICLFVSHMCVSKCKTLFFGSW